MKAVAVTAPGAVAVVDVAAPSPAPGDVVVDVVRSGICGTDLKILRGEIPVDLPRVLGHEVIGRVDDGQTRVLVDPFISCSRCASCRAGREHLCPKGALMGRDTDGGLTEQIVVEPHRLHRVPDDIDDRSASLLQVLGTCVHALGRVRAATDSAQTAVVIGLGVSGLLNVQLLRDLGVDTVVGITRSPDKRTLATQLGADATADPSDAVALVDEVTHGVGTDLVVECAGTAATLAQAFELARPGGTIVMFGITSRAPDLPLYDVYYKELTLVGARAARGVDYDRGIELAAAGRVDLAALWSADFPLHDAAGALQRLGDPGALKVTMSAR